MAWFHGFELPIIINDKREIINFSITQANVDDRGTKGQKFPQAHLRKAVADKGYISKELMQVLLVNGVHLITQRRNNIKNSLMTLWDKILLRKRSIIETVNDELKNICQIEHSRLRSFGNFMTNLICGLIAYSSLPKKLSIKYQTIKTQQLAIFLIELRLVVFSPYPLSFP